MRTALGAVLNTFFLKLLSFANQYRTNQKTDDLILKQPSISVKFDNPKHLIIGKQKLDFVDVEKPRGALIIKYKRMHKNKRIGRATIYVKDGTFKDGAIQNGTYRASYGTKLKGKIKHLVMNEECDTFIVEDYSVEYDEIINR